MAAYAALVSLTHILNQILNPPPGHQLIIIRKQFESLQSYVNFLIYFLENYSSKRSPEIENLGTRIADAAYEAEDIIESNVVDQIHEGSSMINREKISIELCEGVETVMEKFHSIKKELVEKIENKKGVEDQQSKTATSASSSRPVLINGKNKMVGFEEHLIELMSTLTTHESNLRIVPVVGMGGIGKTTLATNVYNHPFITELFYIRAWVTISQESNVRELVLGLLHQISNTVAKEHEMRDDQLGELLYKELLGRKYLIVMDDMWNIEAFDEVNRFLPNNTNGSRILVTTRLLNLAVEFGSCSPHKMVFLDAEQSWDLLREKVFAQQGCPVELEGIGKRIARKCRGLPLAIVVIGGLLAKSKRARREWEYVKGDVTSVVNYGNDEYFMKISSLSYSHLPRYLKPCFLYVAMFPEDFAIRVSRLVRLWVAEGFIKPNKVKSLEEAGNEYLEDLVDRNLILVRKRGSIGKVKTCSVHDLLRDLCKREARKDKFLYLAKLNKPNISPHVESKRRLSIHPNISQVKETECRALQSAVLNRSLLSFFTWNSSPIARKFKLLRVLEVVDEYSAIEIQQLINLRYVAFVGSLNLGCHFISLFWNLETLDIKGTIILPPEIWQMPQLRHVKVDRLYLCNPPVSQMDDQNIIVLENLQTLSEVVEFVCVENVFKRIPNLIKLRTFYLRRSMGFGPCHLRNLVHLRKLKSLRLSCHGSISSDLGAFSDNIITFPSSLKKLVLHNCKIPWEDMSIVGSLPNLEVFKLWPRAAKGLEWNPIEGEFCRLKLLLIEKCELEIWEADNTHFPCLETLLLAGLSLKEIPMGFAEIATLQLIKIWGRNHSLVASAMEIKEQQEMLGNEGLKVISID